MNGNNNTRNRVDVSLNRATAKIINRITDRIFPPDPKINPNWWKKCVLTYIGSIVWALYGIYIAFPEYIRSLDIVETPIQYQYPETFMSPELLERYPQLGYKLEIPPIADIQIDAPFTAYGFYIILALILPPLISFSFDRGRPLTFFFWGMIFPLLTIRILLQSFPSSG